MSTQTILSLRVEFLTSKFEVNTYFEILHGNSASDQFRNGQRCGTMEIHVVELSQVKDRRRNM